MLHTTLDVAGKDLAGLGRVALQRVFQQEAVFLRRDIAAIGQCDELKAQVLVEVVGMGLHQEFGSGFALMDRYTPLNPPCS